MISGRIMLDGKRKIAIWNILDWRNPDLVMEKSLALLSSGIQGRMLLRNRRELIHLGQVRTPVLPRDECACFPRVFSELVCDCLYDAPLSRILHTGTSLRYCRMSRSSYSGFQKSRMNSRLSQSPSSFARSRELSTFVYRSHRTRRALPPPLLPFAQLAAWPLEADPLHGMWQTW